jgi:NADH-quinone oxidoreductase subunit N
MTPGDLLPLAPMIALAVTAIVAMIATPFGRSQRLVAVITMIGLATSLALLGPAGASGARQVTPLLVMDGFALFYTGMIVVAAMAVTLLSYGYLRQRPVMRCEFYVLLVLATLGAAVLASSRHFASLFLGLEILSVALYGLIGYQRAERRGIEAALKYLVLGGVSSAMLLFGMALLYAEKGTLDLGVLMIGWAPTAPIVTVLALAGVGLILVGVGFKLSLAPMHLWAADVYQGAPAPVTAFVATISKAAVFAVLLRFYDASGLGDDEPLVLVLTVLAIASMFVGNLLALAQRNLKRLLAYSSIAHMGYLLVALLAAGDLRATAVTYYLVAYVATTLGAFGIITVLSGGRGEAESLADYRGLAWRRPVVAAALVAMLLSLAGIPLTAGFVGKFYVLAAGVESGLWLPVVALAVNSTLGLYYYLRVIVMIFRRPEENAEAPAHVILPVAGGAALAVLVLAVVWLGVYPGPMIDLIQSCLAQVSGVGAAGLP